MHTTQCLHVRTWERKGVLSRVASKEPSSSACRGAMKRAAKAVYSEGLPPQNKYIELGKPARPDQARQAV